MSCRAERLSAQVVNWAQMYDCHGDDRVPELLNRVERENAAEAWDELGYRLVLECDVVFPAGFAALPRLVRLPSRSARARGLAGTIVRGAAGGHGCDGDRPVEEVGLLSYGVATARKFLSRFDRPLHFVAAPMDSSVETGRTPTLAGALVLGLRDGMPDPAPPPATAVAPLARVSTEGRRYAASGPATRGAHALVTGGRTSSGRSNGCTGSGSCT